MLFKKQESIEKKEWKKLLELYEKVGGDYVGSTTEISGCYT